MSTRKHKKSSISYYYFITLKNLLSKYNSFEYSYPLLCINNIIYTEKCHIVARFKDYLYYDDATEFCNKFFPKNELYKTLPKIFNFYDKYCKVFPNYMILPENEFIYRNLRKKQKMIDQFNEIKREEEENRKHLKLEKNKNNENDYVLFNKIVQDSIEKYRPSFMESTIIRDDYMNFKSKNKNDSKIINENSITISLNYNNGNIIINNNDLNDINTSELSIISIVNNIGISSTERNYNDNKLSYTPKKKQKEEKAYPKNNDFNKKFISHYHNIKNIHKANKDNHKVNINNNSNYKKSSKNNNNINNNLNNSTKKNAYKNNNMSQSKTSNNLFTSSVTKTNKEINSKNIYKNIKSNITKKQLFSPTEKTIHHKKPIYNYINKKLEKNSNSININKYKKNYKDIISISAKPSISPPNSKLNSLKLKFMNNIISKTSNLNNKSNILIYNNSNNSNNISYITKNKNRKSFQTNENNKNNISKNKVDNKKINNNKKTVKEIMENYKNILKTKKSNHYSDDINKNNFFSNKNIFTNLIEKNIKLNTSKINNKKKGIYNKYISPGNKKNTMINGKNTKTPLKPELKMNEKYHNIIIKTKEGSQVKMQTFIKKIFEKK